jgi:Ca2+-binding EF-hand superfamily protein
MKALITTLLLATSFVAFAQEGANDGQKAEKPKKDPAKVFEGLDKNKDGKVSKEEFMANKKGDWAAQGEKNFAGKDKNSDEVLTLEEFTAKKAK